MLVRLLTILILFLFSKVNGQDKDKLATFHNRIILAKSPEQKVRALLDLAEYYSIYKLEERADSLLHVALSEAEVANDKNLVLRILYNNNITNLSTYNSIERFEKTEEFIRKGLTYAQETRNDEYIVLSFIQLSRLSRFRGQFESALEYSNKAFTAIGDRKADSLKCILYVETGDNYASRPDPVSANKNYNNAFEIAYELKDRNLLSMIYHRLSELYHGLGNKEEAKQFLLKSLELNLGAGASEALYQDYFNLARLTENRSYIENAIDAAKDCGSERCLLAAKRLYFSWYMVKGESCATTLSYFYGNPDMVQTYRNLGPSSYYLQLGNIYLYCGNADSAEHYFKLALQEVGDKYDDGFRLDVYLSLAQAYGKKNDIAKGIATSLYALEIAEKKGDPRYLVGITDSLSRLYARQNDFQNAYRYKLMNNTYSGKLDELVEKDKLAVLEIERENSRQVADRDELKRRTDRKHNLQLMGITVFLTVIFSFMLLLGLFNVSKTTIRLTGYFAFISLFEFIIVLLEKPMIKFTHHEPLKVWAIKIILIAILVPIQHFLEGRLITFLQSRKLLEAKRNFFVKRKQIAVTTTRKKGRVKKDLRPGPENPRPATS